MAYELFSITDFPSTGSLFDLLPKSDRWAYWYYNQFLRAADLNLSSDSSTEWVFSQQETTGTAVHKLASPTPFGALQVETGTTSTDYVLVRKFRSPIRLSATKKTYFEVVINPTSLTATDWLIGLGVSPINTAAALAFQLDNTVGTLDLYGHDGTTSEVSELVATPVSQYYRLGFIHDPTVPEVQAYLDGAEVGTAIATRIPAAGLHLDFQVYLETAAAASKRVDVNSVLIAQST